MEILAWILAFIVAITIHEAAHAWMADRLGDPTARLMGRLSLNPLVHYDIVGTSLLLVLTLMRAFGIPVIPFGWAKPVPFDPYNLKNPRRDAGLISLAGPVSNIILVILLSVILRLPFSAFYGILFTFAFPMILINLSLALFNLLPINPLDGGKIFVGFLPEKQAVEAEIFLQKYGLLILFFLIFPTVRGESPLSLVFSPVIYFLIKILIPVIGYI